MNTTELWGIILNGQENFMDTEKILKMLEDQNELDTSFSEDAFRKFIGENYSDSELIELLKKSLKNVYKDTTRETIDGWFDNSISLAPEDINNISEALELDENQKIELKDQLGFPSTTLKESILWLANQCDIEEKDIRTTLNKITNEKITGKKGGAINHWLGDKYFKFPYPEQAFFVAEAFGADEELKKEFLGRVKNPEKTVKEIIHESKQFQNLEDEEIINYIYSHINDSEKKEFGKTIINKWFMGPFSYIDSTETAEAIAKKLNLNNDEKNQIIGLRGKALFERIKEEIEKRGLMNNSEVDLKTVTAFLEKEIKNEGLVKTKEQIKQWIRHGKAYICSEEDGELLAEKLGVENEERQRLIGLRGSALFDFIKEEIAKKLNINAAKIDEKTIIDFLYKNINDNRPRIKDINKIREWKKGKGELSGEDLKILKGFFDIDMDEETVLLTTKGKERRDALISIMNKNDTNNYFKKVKSGPAVGTDVNKYFEYLVNIVGPKKKLKKRKDIEKWINNGLLSADDAELIAKTWTTDEDKIKKFVNDCGYLGNDLYRFIKKKTEEKCHSKSSLEDNDLLNALDELVNGEKKADKKIIKKWLNGSAGLSDRNDAERIAKALKMNDEDSSKFIEDCGLLGTDLDDYLRTKLEENNICKKGEKVNVICKNLNKDWNSNQYTKPRIGSLVRGKMKYVVKLTQKDDPFYGLNLMRKLIKVIGVETEDQTNKLLYQSGFYQLKLLDVIRDIVKEKDRQNIIANTSDASGYLYTKFVDKNIQYTDRIDEATIKSWIEENSNIRKRDEVIKILFALNSKDIKDIIKKSNELLNKFGFTALFIKNVSDCIYIYCLKHNKNYKEALEVYEYYQENKNMSSNLLSIHEKGDIKEHTEYLRSQFSKVLEGNNIDEFKKFLCENAYLFDGQSDTSLLNFMMIRNDFHLWYIIMKILSTSNNDDFNINEHLDEIQEICNLFAIDTELAEDKNTVIKKLRNISTAATNTFDAQKQKQYYDILTKIVKKNDLLKDVLNAAFKISKRNTSDGRLKALSTSVIPHKAQKNLRLHQEVWADSRSL